MVGFADGFTVPSGKSDFFWLFKSDPLSRLGESHEEFWSGVEGLDNNHINTACSFEEIFICCPPFYGPPCYMIEVRGVCDPPLYNTPASRLSRVKR